MDGERAGARGTPGQRASGEPPRGRRSGPPTRPWARLPETAELDGRAGGAAGAPGWAGLGWREEANRATLCQPPRRPRPPRGQSPIHLSHAKRMPAAGGARWVRARPDPAAHAVAARLFPGCVAGVQVGLRAGWNPGPGEGLDQG